MGEQTVSAECTACRATGLYVGMAERKGDSVVCHVCKGTGRATIRYTPFVARRDRDDVRRVFAVNPGIVTAPGVVPGGVPVGEWVDNPSAPSRRGAEMREHTCPAWWYQCANYDMKPSWPECDANIGGRFSGCSRFGRKAQCWQKFDAEQKP